MLLLVVVMALEECVSDLICFRRFFDEWREELSTKTLSDSADNEVLTVTFREFESSNVDLPFETFAAQEMGCDIVPELDADCRLVSQMWLVSQGHMNIRGPQLFHSFFSYSG